MYLLSRDLLIVFAFFSLLCQFLFSSLPFFSLRLLTKTFICQRHALVRKSLKQNCICNTERMT
jgi:hypothetical protein